MQQTNIDDFITLKLSKIDWMTIREEIVNSIRKAVHNRDWQTMRANQKLLAKIDEGLNKIKENG